MTGEIQCRMSLFVACTSSMLSTSKDWARMEGFGVSELELRRTARQSSWGCHKPSAKIQPCSVNARRGY